MQSLEISIFAIIDSSLQPEGTYVEHQFMTMQVFTRHDFVDYCICRGVTIEDAREAWDLLLTFLPPQQLNTLEVGIRKFVAEWRKLRVKKLSSGIARISNSSTLNPPRTSLKSSEGK